MTGGADGTALRRALYGNDEPLPEETLLSAGPLTAILSDGALRAISVQGVEVIRGISFLVRDRNWATAVPEIRDLRVTKGRGRFGVSFSAHCRTPSDGEPLVWHGRIEGSAAAGLTFSAEATPAADFRTCRTGFVVLHPLDRVVGAPATLEHTDGRIVETVFPDLVDPLQCFFDLRAITHEPIPGIRATCRMEGGAWETEDHRNWLDASFKTYFRPLSLPWPYVVPAGETIAQAVRLTFSPSIAKLAPAVPAADVTVTVGDRSGGRMPRIGLAVQAEELAAGLAAAPAIRAVGAQALSVRIRTDGRDLPGVLRQAAELGGLLGVRPALEIVVSARGDAAAELDLAAAAAAAAGLVPAAVFVTPEIDLKSFPPSVDRPPSPPLAPLYSAARAAFPGVPLGGGMVSFFTELNRRRPPAGLLDFVQHATAANVHAADDRSVMETLEALPHVFRSARSFLGGAAYHVGPAAIGMPFNPYGAATSPNPHRLKRTMVTDDPRHKAQFGAAYAAGYLARAALAGIDQVTMGSPAGPFGLTDDDGVTQMMHVLSGFARLAGAALLQTASSDPRALLAVAAEGRGGRELWLANLTPETRTVRLGGLAPAAVALLEAGAQRGWIARAADAGLALGAYAVARVRA
jgi:hypothetical protein